jgi:hypothetical protein
MSTKQYYLSELDYSIIISALAKLAEFHFEKSKSLKREQDVQFHSEQFQKIMEVKFNLLEQK